MTEYELPIDVNTYIDLQGKEIKFISKVEKGTRPGCDSMPALYTEISVTMYYDRQKLQARHRYEHKILDTVEIMNIEQTLVKELCTTMFWTGVHETVSSNQMKSTNVITVGDQEFYVDNSEQKSLDEFINLQSTLGIFIQRP